MNSIPPVPSIQFNVIAYVGSHINSGIAAQSTGRLTIMFTEQFGRYVCDGDQITTTVDGFDVTATIVRDDDSHIDDDDCHNPDQSVTGCDDEQFAKLLNAREAWDNDEWWYVGVVLSVEFQGVELTDHAASLWGIECNHPESDNAYLTEVANELLPEALEQARKELEALRAKLCG